MEVLKLFLEFKWHVSVTGDEREPTYIYSKAKYFTLRTNVFITLSYITLYVERKYQLLIYLKVDSPCDKGSKWCEKSRELTSVESNQQQGTKY